MNLSVLISVIAVIIVLAVILFFVLRQYRKVGPNEVLIISGGKKNIITLPDGTTKEIGFRYRIGGGMLVNPFTQQTEKLSVEVIPIKSKIPEVLASNGIPVSVDFNGQVRIDTDEYPLYVAITNFLSGGKEAIMEVARSVLESKVRELIGTMSVEEVYTKSNEFNRKIYESVQEDFTKMGLLLMSFGLEEISDTQGYIEALSKPHVTAAKYKAAVDQSEKDKEITIKSADAKKEGEIARLAADAEVAGATSNNEAKKAESLVLVNQKKAQADMAYEMERIKLQQSLKKEEYAVKFVEMEESSKLEDINIKRKEKELNANVLKPAEARKSQVRSEAEAERFRIETEAQGKAEAMRLENEQEAERIRKVGQAEAESLANKAKAYESYNQAALYELIMSKMPDIAKAVSEPLSRVDKIVMIENDGKSGSPKLTRQITEIVSQLPELVEALTGADLKKILRKKTDEEETSG